MRSEAIGPVLASGVHMGVYSDESDHPFRGKATSWLRVDAESSSG
jgi:hypothetical protein